MAPHSSFSWSPTSFEATFYLDRCTAREEAVLGYSAHHFHSLRTPETLSFFFPGAHCRHAWLRVCAENFHVIFSTDCSAFQDWQSILAFLSAESVGHKVGSPCTHADNSPPTHTLRPHPSDT